MNDAKLSADHVDEIDAVREVILDYVRGAHSGDTGLLSAIFHPDARMYGFLNGDATNVPIGQFIEMVKGFTAPAQSGEPYRAAIASITVHGSIAVADLREANYQGMDFIDVFSLLRTEGRWQIVTKCYQQLS
jgi:hypothetical protein